MAETAPAGETSRCREEADCDAIVIGTGPGGSVAILRLAQAGKKVLALERGRWFTTEPYRVGLGALWMPRPGVFGHHEFRFLARTVTLRLPFTRRTLRFPSRLLGSTIAWLGSGVGGGTHVWANTMMRAAPEVLDRFPKELTRDALERHYYPAVERVMSVTPYPDRPPYGDSAKTRAMRAIGEAMVKKIPGARTFPLPMSIHFAAPGQAMGEDFTNEHGVPRRTFDLRDVALLRGSWRTTATTDSNYLAAALATGRVTILALHEADRIEALGGAPGETGYRVYATDRSAGAGRRGRSRAVSFTASSLFLAAGAIGTTELLLRNRDLHRTLPRLSPLLGHRFGTNGDRLGLAIPARPCDPTRGPVNSRGVALPNRDGSPGVFVIDGAYAHALVLVALSLLDALGVRSRRVDRALIAAHRWVDAHLAGPLACLYPLPLLGMNAAPYRGEGTVRLDRRGRAMVDIPAGATLAADQEMDAATALMAESIAPASGPLRWWSRVIGRAPRIVYRALRKTETPHNQGGVPMGDDERRGAADHTGRLFGYGGLYAADGSLLPPALGTNPTEPLMALVERNMTHILFPDHQRLLRDRVRDWLRAPEGLAPGEAAAEIGRRLDAEARSLQEREPTGLLHRPEGKARAWLIARVRAELPDLASAALGPGDLLPDLLRHLADRWVARVERLTPEALEALPDDTA
ncbi:MAG: GMC family oxidoreductase [Armatimonadetes bacterium]|nr:GMC family oxidoreductase [Armatimonadota bacterium]